MKISIVVLHYQNLEVTKRCIECLNKLQDISQCNIIVVDNGSPNKSGAQLEDYYKYNSNIYILVSESNLGFAQGNNLGYTFAKHNLKSDIIIVINNDILIKQVDFIKRLKNYENINKVEIIAPDIINLKGIHQNPFRKNKISSSRLLLIHYYNLCLQFIYRIPILNKIILNILLYKNKNKKICNYREDNSLSNIVPHGSCIIYLKSWIIKENVAFLPQTFMYFEEDILFDYIDNKSYLIEYWPELCVEHLEDVSVNTSTKNELEKRKFISLNIAKSTNILIKMRKNI